MNSRLHDIEKLFQRVLRDLPRGREQCQALLRMYHDLVLTISDSSLLQFNTLFARVSYLTSRYHLSKAWAYAMQIPRRELHQRQMEDQDLISILKSCIEYLLQLGDLPSVSGEPVAVNAPRLPRLPSTRKQGIFKKYFARVVAVEWDREKKTLHVLDEAEPDKTIPLLYAVHGVNDIFSDTLELAIEELGLPMILGLTYVDVTEDDQYIPGYILIMPDLLLDVTAIADYHSIGSDPPAINILDHFLPSQATVPILAGKVANYFLDELIRDTSLSFDLLFARSFKIYPIEFVKLSDEEVRALMRQLKTHFEHILDVVVNRFGSVGIDRSKCVIEPSYFSPQFGIKGRLDVYYQHDQEQTASIIELKSSKPFKPNPYGLSHSHYHQTLLYELLIKSVHGPQHHRANFILYSAMAENPLRYAVSVESIQKEAIQNRNQSVLLQFRLMRLDQSGSRDILSEIDPLRFESVKGFLKSNASRFHAVYNQLTHQERNYLKAFTAFIAREHMIARIGSDTQEGIGGLAGLWLDSISQKEERYHILQGLQLIHIRQEGRNTTLSFKRTDKTNPLANFRAGDIAILYPFEEITDLDPTHYQLHRASVVAVDAVQVTIQLRNPQIHFEQIERTHFWNIEHDLLDSSFKSLYQSTWSLMCADTRVRRFILGTALPPLPESRPVVEMPGGLSPAQQRIFAEGIHATSLYLLWGPPGTGKTSIMLRSWVEYYFKFTSARILLLAYTNRAVDEICAALHASGDGIGDKYIRVGSRTASGEEYKSRLLDHVIEPMMKRSDIKTALEQTRIIVGTVASVQGKNELFELLHFDIAIVDEASQLLEPSIIGLMTRAGKTILIGDHMQLPAVSAQTDESNRFAADEAWATQIGLTDLRMSYFERLYRHYQARGWHHSIGTLQEQGRMHADIMRFPNEYVYGGQLSCTDHGALIEPLSIHFAEEESPEVLGRLLFIPSESTLTEVYSKTNAQEAEIVIRLIANWKNRLESLGLKWTIGVITPFRAQIAAITYLAHQRGMDLGGITVDTVERYQGGARDIIIMSCAVNHLSTLQRISSMNAEGIDRKLNVAVTRAKQQFVFTGVEDVLSQSRSYEALLHMSKKVDMRAIMHTPTGTYLP